MVIFWDEGYTNWSYCGKHFTINMCIKLSHDTPRFTQCYRLTISQIKKGKKKSQQIWGSMAAIVDKVCKGKAKKF